MTDTYTGIRYYFDCDDWVDLVVLVPSQCVDTAISLICRAADICGEYTDYRFDLYTVMEYIGTVLDKIGMAHSFVTIMDFDDSCRWVDYLDYVDSELGLLEIITHEGTPTRVRG